MANFLTDERGGRDVLMQGELRTKKWLTQKKVPDEIKPANIMILVHQSIKPAKHPSFDFL